MDEPDYTPLPQRKRRTKRKDEDEEVPEEKVDNEDAEAISWPEEPPQREHKRYCYKDHSADIQIHSTGKTMEEAYENQVLGMFDYMTELDKVDITDHIDIVVSGANESNLLYMFLSEVLYRFSGEFFTVREIKIVKLDRENLRIHARAWGEIWDMEKHPQGTEIKAITYASMQVNRPGEDPEVDPDLWSVYVIVDI